MNENLQYIVDNLCNGNRSSFAREINITPAYAHQLCTGVRAPSDRTIADICRIFNVIEAWLRTGIGEPFIQLSREEEIASILGKVIAGHDSEKSAFIRALARIPDDAFPAITQLFLAVAEELQKDQ